MALALEQSIRLDPLSRSPLARDLAAHQGGRSEIQKLRPPGLPAAVSTALPRGISVYEEGGQTILATLKPTTLPALFNGPQLEGLAQEEEDTIVKIMEETASA